jgi:hypothetical protein
LIVPLVGLETAADRIQAYEPMVVHGLLQTADYTRAIIRAGRPDLPSPQIERWVDLRMTRQALLTRDNPPEFTVVLEESALRRPVGGVSVLQGQLRRLAEAAELPSVTLQVIPLRVGEHAALSGAFNIYHFSGSDDPDVVYLEDGMSDLYLESNEQVQRYAAAFERLRMAALSPEDTSLFLSKLIAET